MVTFVSERAQKRIRAIQKSGRFVEIIEPNQNSKWKRGAVHSIILSCQVRIHTNTLQQIMIFSDDHRILQKQEWKEWSRNRPA